MAKRARVNQCDGCKRGLPVVNGIHRGDRLHVGTDNRWPDAMACTRGRYVDEPTPDERDADREMGIDESTDPLTGWK